MPRKILQENPRQNPPKFIRQKSPTHFCRGAGPTYCAVVVRYPMKTSPKEFCDTIATTIVRYEKYRCWATKSRSENDLLSRILFSFWPPLLATPLPPLLSAPFRQFPPPRKVLCSVERGAQRTAWRGAVSGWTSPQSSGRKFPSRNLPYKRPGKHTVLYYTYPTKPC